MHVSNIKAYWLRRGSDSLYCHGDIILSHYDVNVRNPICITLTSFCHIILWKWRFLTVSLYVMPFCYYVEVKTLYTVTVKSFCDIIE